MGANRKRFSAMLILLAGIACTSPVVAQIVNPTTGDTYFLTDVPVGIQDARFVGGLVGGYVVAVNDAAEAQWLEGFAFNQSFRVWIGLSDELVEGTFLWDSGDPLTYTDWATGQPDNLPSNDANYVKWDFGSGWFDDVATAFEEYAVIETPETLGPSVTDLTCSAVGTTGVQISWTDPTTYTSIDIYRDGALLVTLAGDATDYFDAGVDYHFHVYAIQGIDGSTLSRPRTCLGASYYGGNTLHLQNAHASIGEAVQVSITLDNDEPLSGWSFGVCSDPAQLELQEVLQGSATAGLNGGGGPDFYSVNTPLSGVGFALGVVVSFLGTGYLPPGTGQELNVAVYDVLASPPGGATLQFCSSIGLPPVVTVVVQESGQALVPLTEDGSVSPYYLLRGDCNHDATVDVADVLYLGEQLFTAEDSLPCKEACEINGDAKLDIADMVYLLSFLFEGGTAPPAPFPACGPDPESSTSFGCDETGCP